MPLNLSAVSSSRISKRPQQQLRRSASSPFSDFSQRKPIQRSQSKADVADDDDDDDDDDFFKDRLDDKGIVNSLASDLSLRDVAQTIQYVRSHMFGTNFSEPILSHLDMKTESQDMFRE